MDRGDEVGLLNRATCTDVVTKSRTTLYFLQQIFATIKNLICGKAGLKVGGKQATSLFNSFAVILQNKLHVFVGRFATELKGLCHGSPVHFV